ncbi:MAG: hypothetical protein MUP09_03125 [Thiovulaceae bacterium]|nr:hypothetical protein [Sulfurimonadaceae bacterium]
MSKSEEAEKEKVPEVRAPDKDRSRETAPTERDHYVYESIIAEIGY